MLRRSFICGGMAEGNLEQPGRKGERAGQRRRKRKGSKKELGCCVGGIGYFK